MLASISYFPYRKWKYSGIRQGPNPVSFPFLISLFQSYVALHWGQFACHICWVSFCKLVCFLWFFYVLVTFWRGWFNQSASEVVPFWLGFPLWWTARWDTLLCVSLGTSSLIAFCLPPGTYPWHITTPCLQHWWNHQYSINFIPWRK